MNAVFVQVDAADLSKLEANPELAESLFTDGPAVPPQFATLARTAQDRMRAMGPEALSRLDPRLRQQLEASMNRVKAAGGPDAILKMMQDRMQARSGGVGGKRSMLSLDKAWHGVHYVLCGEAEPGDALLSQPVLGGTDLGDDEEGFSGYGPARYFTGSKVGELSQALNRAETEPEAAARFDAERMSQLQIYPGWRSSMPSG